MLCIHAGPHLFLSAQNPDVTESAPWERVDLASGKPSAAFGVGGKGDTPPLIGSCLGSFGTDCVSYDNKELIEMREPISFSFPTEK
jgi:hypothetical protein